jgi:hypothetical protein
MTAADGNLDRRMDRGNMKRPAGTDIAGNGDLIAAVEVAATEHPAMIAVDIGGSRQRRYPAQAGGEFAGAAAGADDEDTALIEPAELATAE